MCADYRQEHTAAGNSWAIKLLISLANCEQIRTLPPWALSQILTKFPFHKSWNKKVTALNTESDPHCNTHSIPLYVTLSVNLGGRISWLLSSLPTVFPVLVNNVIILLSENSHQNTCLSFIHTCMSLLLYFKNNYLVHKFLFLSPLWLLDLVAPETIFKFFSFVFSLFRR